MVSIICPTYNEERFIEACIQSVLNQDIPTDSWELLLVDGGSTDRTRERMQPYIDQYANIHLLDNPYRTAPYAMNIGIRKAKGEYICRMDAHSAFPANYISALMRYLNELPDAANVGAACRTLPANNSTKAKAIAIACQHPFGVGNSAFRTTTVKQPIQTDTVPFGFWKKSVFETVGYFNESLTRNQDDEFNARTIEHGKKIYLVPDLSVTYYARDNIGKTARMFYQYGLFKPLVNKQLKRPATIRQFVPLAFLVGLVVGFPLVFLHPVILGTYCAGILLYVMCLTGIAAYYGNIYLPLVFATIHFSYGFGYLAGICKILLKQSFNVETNR